jgi:hypothetical protein
MTSKYDRGISPGSVIFVAVGETAEGASQTFRLAFDATGDRGVNSGLKQFGNGSWHDVHFI